MTPLDTVLISIFHWDMLAVVTWAVSFYFMFLGWYLLWPAEIRCPGFGFGFAALGALMYIIHQLPGAIPPPLTVESFVIVFLLVLWMLGIFAAQWIWRINQLAPPHKRLLCIVLYNYHKLHTAEKGRLSFRPGDCDHDDCAPEDDDND